MENSDSLEAVVEQGFTISFGYCFHSSSLIGHKGPFSKLLILCIAWYSGGLDIHTLIYYQILNLHPRIKLLIGTSIHT